MKNTVIRKDLFDNMIVSINELALDNNIKNHEAFGEWFSKLYFQNHSKTFKTDGSGDGKVDFITEYKKGNRIMKCALNSKYTGKYDSIAPPSFYSEALDFYNMFANKKNRENAIMRVREGLRKTYYKLFNDFDNGDLDLIFITTHKKNTRSLKAVGHKKLQFIHLEELLQYYSEFIEGAKPVSIEPLLLNGITTVLSADSSESEVPTSIVFARIIDFVDYMRDDTLELLFARNVRLYLGDTGANKDIRDTYENNPKEFVFSNNGVTILCKSITHNPGQRELTINGPRVVNGSQTLHSIMKAKKHNPNARVMVRIIQVPSIDTNLEKNIEKRKEIIHKISIRTNMQNPIKKWDLVSNDDFQNQIGEFFMKKKFYYERRQKEWKTRREYFRELKINYATGVKELTQLLSCYNLNSKAHGPAIAHGNISALFDEKDDAYLIISRTDPQVAYQLYHLFRIQNIYLEPLYKKKRNPLSKSLKLIIFTMLVKDLKTKSGFFGSDKTSCILDEFNDSNCKDLNMYFDNCINTVMSYYNKIKPKYFKEEDMELTIANFAKNNSFVKDFIDNYKTEKNKKLIIKVFES